MRFIELGLTLKLNWFVTTGYPAYFKRSWMLDGYLGAATIPSGDIKNFLLPLYLLLGLSEPLDLGGLVQLFC